MKIIGVMGKPGSGKTTFSDYLGTKDNVGVIHVDDLVANIKKKYFRIFLQPKENNKTENVKNNPKLKSGIKEKFYKNKFLFSLLMIIRTKLIEKDLFRTIESFKSNGKDLVVIDDWALPYQNKLFKKLDKIYSLERDFLERRDSLKKRDDLTVRELKVYDLPYSIGLIRVPENEIVTRIFNKGSFGELREIADKEYEKIGILSFNERYKVKTPQVSLDSLTQSINKSKDILYKQEARDKN